jgi:hypothetical protein
MWRTRFARDRIDVFYDERHPGTPRKIRRDRRGPPKRRSRAYGRWRKPSAMPGPTLQGLSLSAYKSQTFKLSLSIRLHVLPALAGLVAATPTILTPADECFTRNATGPINIGNPSEFTMGAPLSWE